MRMMASMIGYKLKLMVNNKGFLFFMLLIPLLITFMVGHVQTYERQNRVPIALVDEDNSAYAKQVVDGFAKHQEIQVIQTDETKALSLVENYQAEAAFIIQKGFAEAVQRGDIEGIITLVKSPNSQSYDLIKDMLASEVMRLHMNVAAADWTLRLYKENHLYQGQQSDQELWQSVWDYADSLWEPQPLMTLDYQERRGAFAVTEEHIPISVLTSVSTGMVIMFLMLMIMFHSSWIIEERNNATLKRLVSISGLLRKYYMASIIALFCLAGLQLLLMALLMKVLFGVHLFWGPWQGVILATYIFAVIALGMLFASLFKTPVQMQAGAPAIALLTSIVGGCFWSFIEPSKQLKELAFCTPQGWALEAMKGIAMETYQIQDVLTTALLLLLFGLVVCGVSFWRIKRIAME